MDFSSSAPVVSIRSRLLREIRFGAFKDAARLPRESVLAEMLSISRTQLRDDLAELEREGFITRRHGIGTIINRHVLAVKVRTDLEVEFIDMLRQSGYDGAEELIAAQEMDASPAVREKLALGEGERILFAARVVTADGRRAIYCEDYIPCRLVRRGDYGTEEFQAPIFDFLLKYCEVEPYLDLTEIRPVTADGRLSALLGVNESDPLLFMDEVDYSIDGSPVLYSAQYYIDGVVRHTLMRKKF